MKRTRVIERLLQELNKLKEADIRSLMRENRIEELERIAKELDFSYLQNYLDSEEYLDLRMREIPEGLSIEIAFYISKAEIDDDDVFENCFSFRERLKKEGGEKISEKMRVLYLYEMTTGDFCRLLS